MRDENDPLALEPPDALDFEKAILRIHAQERSIISPERLRRCVAEALASGRNNRWLEDYAINRILSRIGSYCLEHVTPQETPLGNAKNRTETGQKIAPVRSLIAALLAGQVQEYTSQATISKGFNTGAWPPPVANRVAA